MIDSLDMSLQALGAFAHAAGDTARNVANVSTEGYRPVRTLIEAGPFSVTAVTEPASASGGVDLSREMVGLMESETAYQANAKVVRTQDEATGSLLDLLA